MKLKRNPEQPVSVTVPLILISCVILIGLVTLILVKNKNSTTATQTETKQFIAPSSATKTYTDTAHKFSFLYPANWDTDFPSKGAVDGPALPDPDWNTVSRPVLIKPISGGKGNNVSVYTACTADTVTQIRARKDSTHTQQDTSINGNVAFYDEEDYKTTAESYLTHTYIILGKSACVQISYRERLHYPANRVDFDDSKNMPGFETIVNSVKFQ